MLAQLLFTASATAEGHDAAEVEPQGRTGLGIDDGMQEQKDPDLVLSGRLVCNELDPGRRRRLLGVLRDYVPEALRQQLIRCGLWGAGALGLHAVGRQTWG